jgi:hypothetical protein
MRNAQIRGRNLFRPENLTDECLPLRWRGRAVATKRFFAHRGAQARACAKASCDHRPGASGRTPKT